MALFTVHQNYISPGIILIYDIQQVVASNARQRRKIHVYHRSENSIIFESLKFDDAFGFDSAPLCDVISCDPSPQNIGKMPNLTRLNSSFLYILFGKHKTP